MRWMVCWLALAAGAAAQDQRAGVFDYYVLALSWSPGWCLREGDARDAPQCDTALGWSLHGLWPQYHRGWPEYCETGGAEPTRREAREMADIMGSHGLAYYQWRKHGSCSGLSPGAYFRLSREAYDRVSRPPVFRRLEEAVRLPASVVESAFLDANPGLEPDMITVTCADRQIAEARICLSRALDPVPCGSDVIRDCTLEDALFPPLR
jgi:ribonuclease T2